MVTAKWDHWLPKFLGVEAITIYPWILFSQPKAYTDVKTIIHECVHVTQVKKKGWLWFYFTYLVFYVRGRFRGMDHDDAYRAIPYEIEAFTLQEVWPESVVAELLK